MDVLERVDIYSESLADIGLLCEQAVKEATLRGRVEYLGMIQDVVKEAAIEVAEGVAP